MRSSITVDVDIDMSEICDNLTVKDLREMLEEHDESHESKHAHILCEALEERNWKMVEEFAEKNGIAWTKLRK